MSASNAEPPGVEIVVESPAWDNHPGLDSLIVRAIEAAAAAAGCDGAGREVAVSLADDGLQQELNRDWRSKDSATNVLSFPAAPLPAETPGPHPLGDIVLAYETVARESLDSGRSFESHVVHLAVHGFLHLLGYDHQTGPDADRMEGLESAILIRLGFDDPYDDDPRRPSPD